MRPFHAVGSAERSSAGRRNKASSLVHRRLIRTLTPNDFRERHLCTYGFVDNRAGVVSLKKPPPLIQRIAALRKTPTPATFMSMSGVRTFINAKKIIVKSFQKFITLYLLA